MWFGRFCPALCVLLPVCGLQSGCFLIPAFMESSTEIDVSLIKPPEVLPEPKVPPPSGNNVGLDKDLMLDKKIIQYRKKLVGQAFLDTRILSAVYVSKEEVRNYYLKNKEAFKRLKSEATINTFLISDKKEASRIRANLEKSSNNKKRREMFDRHSVVAETIKDGMLNPKINKRVFSPKKDKYIGPVDLGDVFAVIEVVKRYEKGTYLGLDSVYDTIYLLIYKRKTAIKTQNIIDSLKQEFILETNTNTL